MRVPGSTAPHAEPAETTDEPASQPAARPGRDRQPSARRRHPAGQHVPCVYRADAAGEDASDRDVPAGPLVDPGGPAAAQLHAAGLPPPRPPEPELAMAAHRP